MPMFSVCELAKSLRIDARISSGTVTAEGPRERLDLFTAGLYELAEEAGGWFRCIENVGGRRGWVWSQ